MQKWYYLAGVAVMLAACSQEKDRFIQPTAASKPATASDITLASDVARAASVPVIGASATSAIGASSVAASAASAVAASTPSTPDSVSKSKKIPIGGSTEFGNTVYYFPASIKKEGKLLHVLTENRFDKTQTLPDSGKSFQYSLITEAVDCERRLTDPIAVTHYSSKNEKVESHTFPYPDYNTWTELELQALADEHPDSAFIAAVCQKK